jgi:hypothetical protein
MNSFLIGFVFRSRREPGDWPCQQCNEINFKSRTACRRCSTPRNQPTQTNFAATNATGTNPHAASKPRDWTCYFCNNNNFAARIACHQCGRQKQEPTIPNTASSSAAKPGDWTCPFCNNNNFAARIACRQCGRQKPVPMDTGAPPQTVLKPGDWKCSSCPEINFGSRVVCRLCGTARPSSENKDTNNKSECVICMDKPIDSVITTCGHSAVCLQCGSSITQCPICRNSFNQQQIIKLYNVH